MPYSILAAAPPTTTSVIGLSSTKSHTSTVSNRLADKASALAAARTSCSTFRSTSLSATKNLLPKKARRIRSSKIVKTRDLWATTSSAPEHRKPEKTQESWWKSCAHFGKTRLSIWRKMNCLRRANHPKTRRTATLKYRSDSTIQKTNPRRCPSLPTAAKSNLS